MRATLIFALFIILFFPACKAGQLLGGKNPIDRFLNNAVGLKKGDTIDRVFEIYGEPTEHQTHDDKYSFNTVYYKVKDERIDDERALSFSYFKATRKIYTINVEPAAALFLRQKNVADIVYIGMHADEIRKIFGPKEFGNVEKLEYKNSELEVDFYCYDFNDYKCFDYTIYWWQ